MKTLWISTFALSVALAGCATPEQQAAQAEREMARSIQVYGPACERLGYRADSDPWRSCVLRLSREASERYYSRFPMSTTCFGSPGLLHCTGF